MKHYNQEIIKVIYENKIYTFNCYTYNRPTGFTEVAVCQHDESKMHYYNRSWQRYDYESAIQKWFRKYLNVSISDLELVK